MNENGLQELTEILMYYVNMEVLLIGTCHKIN
jgi:hypothetical protein